MTKLNSSKLLVHFVLFTFIFVAHPYSSSAIPQRVDEQFGLAAGHYERQEYVQAAESFRQLIAEHPDTQQASLGHFFLAECLIQQLDYQSAYPAFQLFLKSNPDHEFAKQARFRMAESAFRLNWLEQATSQFEKFIARYANDPLNEFALNYLGELRLRRDEPQLAQRVFESAIKTYPYSSQASRNRFGLARALQLLGNTDEALRFYNMLTANESNPLYAKSMVQIGIIQFANGSFEAAEQSLAQALDGVTDDSERNQAIYWLARTELAQGKNSSAYENFKRIVKKSFPGNLQSAVLFDAAIAASRSDQTSQAIDWLTRLQTTWPESPWADDATQLKIELLFRTSQHELALKEIARFKSRFQTHPNLPLIREFEGRVFYEQGEFDKTIQTFQDLLNRFGAQERHQDKAKQWRYFLGLGYLGNRNYEAAANELSAIPLQGMSDQFRASVLLAQSSTAVGLGQEQNAITYLEKYLATQPVGQSADRARADLSTAYAKLDRWQQAKRTLVELEDKHTDLEIVLETKLLLAEYALVDKQFEYAETCFADLTDNSYPRKYIVRGLSGLAWVRMSRGDQESSVEVFRKIIKEHGESDFAAESAMMCGRYFEQNRDFDHANSMYDLVLQQYSDTKFAKLAALRHAFCLHQIGGEENLQLASFELQQYLENQQEYLDEAHYQMAWLQLELKDEVKAMNHFWEIATHRPNSKFWPDAAYRIAQWQLQQKNFEEARKLANQLIHKHDTAAAIRARCQFLLGQIAVHQSDWKAVETTMREVLSQIDDEELRKKSRYWLAESLFQQEQYQAALTDFDQLAATPDLVTQRRQAWVKLRRAQTLAYLNRWSAALDTALEGKTQHPDFEAIHEFHFVCGRAHGAQGRLADARICYQQVIESPTGRMSQTAAMAQWRIGETFFHQQDYESAIQSFYKVDSLYAYDKWRAAALIEAGKCQEHLGNWKHAMKLYQRLIEKFPDSNFRVAAEQRLGSASRQAARARANIQK